MSLPFRKFKGFFIPKDLSDNNLRHFGIKSHRLLFLEEHEVLYLLSKDVKDTYPVFVRAYFFLKNNGFNILPTSLSSPFLLNLLHADEENLPIEIEKEKTSYKIYRRTKHFKRTDEPLGLFRFVDKYEDVVFSGPREIVCLLSQDEFIFLEMQEVDALSLEIDPKLRKPQAKK